jgi:RNA polymerase sigma factor (sigma-70 family)
MAPVDVEAAWAKGRIGTARLLPDDRLARRAAAGDERALAAIFDRYHQDLYRFCLAIVGNPADAQDALQNTMVKVLRALPGEKRQVELKPWLYRIAHNESVELLRRRRPTEELDAGLAARGGSLAEDAEARARLRRLLADLELLPDRQRGALVMRELGGLGFEEIGAALGTSPATARQTLYEARQSLRQMDEGREMDCDAVTRALSDADGRVTRRRDIRAHLRACPDCRRFSEEIEGRRRDLGALAPLPAVAATGLLQGLLGGAAAGGAAKSLGAGAAIKSAAAVAAVAVVGVGAADRSGVVDATPWDNGSPAQKERGDGTAAGGGTPGLSRSEGAESGSARGKDGPVDLKSAAALDGGVRAGQGKGVPAAGAEIGAAATAPASGGAPPHGRDHEKQHPEAASHGQQTASGHKAAGKGGSQGRGHAKNGRSSKQAKSAKSAQPEPSKPSQATQPPQPEQSGGGTVNASPKVPSGPGAAAPHPPPQGEAKGNPPAPEGAALAE